jgi:uncharacterized protein YecE (DUF72 family)
MAILVGTCSWSGRTTQQAQKLYGTPRPTAEQELRCYSNIFPTVEVDSTFYALPSLQNCQRWVERTPEDFVFHLKAFSLFTAHGTRTRNLPADIRLALPPHLQSKPQLYLQDVPEPVKEELWRRYQEALEPLQQGGKLGFILLQFAPWFEPSRENADYLLSCRDRLYGIDVAVEFRNRGWFEERLRQRTPEWLRENHLTMVCVDTPQGVDASIPPVAEATAPQSYVRLHGRNTTGWGQHGSSVSNIHDYWYTEVELQEWLGRVRQLGEQTERTYVLFNTVQGWETAQIFQRMVSSDNGTPEALAVTEINKLIERSFRGLYTSCGLT